MYILKLHAFLISVPRFPLCIFIAEILWGNLE